MGQTTNVIRTTLKVKGDLKKKPTSVQSMSDIKYTKKANQRMEEDSCSTITNARLITRTCKE